MSDDADASRTGDEFPAQVSSSAKRKRTSRACDQCRGRKHKCDGRQPTCTPCSMSGSPCNYGSGVRRRGLPAGYVRSLELLWALVFAVVPNGEKVVTDLLNDLEFDLDPGGKLIMVGKLVGDPETLRQSWVKSRVQIELERRLSKLEASVAAGPRSVDSSGLESSTLCLDVSRPGVARFDPIRQSSSSRALGGYGSSVPLSSMGLLSNTRNALHNTTSNRGQPSPNNTQPLAFPPYAQRLLETYFSYTNSWLPIIERHRIFEVLYSSPGSPTTRRGDESTLWAILAYSSLQEARGCVDAASTDGTTDGLGGVEGVCLTPRQMYAQAKRLIPDEEESPELGHGKAFLILSLYQLYRGDLSAAWRLIGHSVRISLVLQGRPHPPTSDKDEDRTYTLLGCFVLDTIVSSHLGKPCHLRSADIRHLPALAETGLNEWEPWSPPRSGRPNPAPGPPEPMRAVSTFNRFVEMIRILNDVMWDPVVGSSADATVRHMASLRRWCDRLPQHCSLPSLPDPGQSTFPSRPSPQLVNLHLAFKSTLVLLRTQHSPQTTHRMPFDQLFPGPHRSFILHLLSTYGEKFGDPATPAIFASYKYFSDTENSLAPSSSNAELETLDPHQARYLPFAVPVPESGADCSTEDVMSTATPSDSIAISHSEQTFPFGFPEGSYTAPADLNRVQSQLSLEHVTLGRAEETSYEHPDVITMGGFPRSDHNFIGDLDSLDGIEWDAQSSEFMLNLGFTGLIPDLSRPMDPP